MSAVEDAELVLPTDDVQETASYFIDRLGFQLHAIFPADDPRHAILSGDGTRICLEKGRNGDPGRLRMRGEGVDLLSTTMPAAQPEVMLTPAAASDADWQTGRAGMLYRDMLPSRWGGCYIVSHIQIPGGGPVPDYVHFHQVRFQMIFCLKGWVRVVYEDQGQPFVMQAGDCVLQPPEIRHRVLESGDGLEVLEIGCPAEHPTLVEHQINLPTGRVNPDRDFGGQRFLRHVAADAVWAEDKDRAGWQSSDLGMTPATDGLATLRRIRSERGAAADFSGKSAFTYLFCLGGQGGLSGAGTDGAEMTPGAGLSIPEGTKVTVDPRGDEMDVLMLELT